MNFKKGISNFFKEWISFFKWIHNKKLRYKVLALSILTFLLSSHFLDKGVIELIKEFLNSQVGEIGFLSLTESLVIGSLIIFLITLCGILLIFFLEMFDKWAYGLRKEGENR